MKETTSRRSGRAGLSPEHSLGPALPNTSTMGRWWSLVAEHRFAVACALSLLVIVLLYTQCLDQSPPYLNRDEAGFGLASYLLATTGRDYYGNLLPPYITYSDRPELGNAILCY